MTILVLLQACLIGTAVGVWHNIEFVSIGNMNGSAGPVDFDFQLTRMTRHSLGVSGHLRVGPDFQQYRSDGRIWFAAKADGNYALTPFHAPSKPMCEQVEAYYVRFVMAGLAAVSDLPQVAKGEEAEACGMFVNQTFAIRDYVFDPTLVPKIFQRGLYKVELRVLNGNDEPVAGMLVVVRLS